MIYQMDGYFILIEIALVFPVISSYVITRKINEVICQIESKLHEIAILHFDKLSEHIRNEESIRHYEGGTTEVICLISIKTS